MRSFQQIVVFLLALVAFAFAQSSDSEVYDSTVYITSTVYRVNTITMSGTPSSAANQTSTIPATYAPSQYPAGTTNATTVVRPSATGAKPSASQFTGAASGLTAPAYLAALAAGLGYLVL